MVTIKPVKIFSNCVIRLPSKSGNSMYEEEDEKEEEEQEQDKQEEEEQNNLEKTLLTNVNAENSDIDIPTLEKSNEIDVGSLDKDNNDTQTLEIPMISTIPEINDIGTEETILEKNDVIQDNRDESTNNINEENDLHVDTNELQEFKIDLDDLTEDVNINIKKDKDIYYEMYREACRKAKIARDLALSSYLEAKRIKNQYMLDDLTESDDSDDSENEEMEEI